MSRAVVFAYAIEDGLQPVVGAAPFDVLARQLPRALVTRLNGDGDRGARFFPFVGPVDGVRDFLRLRERLEPKALLQLHQQGDVELLVDGLLRQDTLTWRVLDGRTGAERLSVELPFDPRDPLAVLARLEFELTGLLGWSGQPTPPPSLDGEALGWYLVLKDEMLRREANLPDSSKDALRPARRCVELAGDDDDVQQLVLDFLALLLRRKEHKEQVAALAASFGPSVADARRLDRLAGIAFAAGAEGPAAAMVVRAALMRPDEPELVERAASMAFRVGDDDGVRRVVDAARRAGAETPAMLAQLAASRDRDGDRDGRAALVDELVGRGDLPVAVARLVVSFLLEEDQAQVARPILERALEASPDHAMLHYELGRACLLLDDTARASVALRRALDLGVGDAVTAQAERMLRLSLVPGLWQGTTLVEKAVAAGDLGAALHAVRALVRRVGPVGEAWLLFGVVNHKLGRLRRAERLLRRSIGYHEPCAEAHNRLGTVLLQIGRVAEGRTHLERAHALDPADSATLLHLAQAQALAGELERAERSLLAAAERGAAPELVKAVRRQMHDSRDSA